MRSKITTLISFSSILTMVILNSAKAQENEFNEGDEIEKKRELLRWFPVDRKEECDIQPGPEQVQITFFYAVASLAFEHERL